jgi:hypothetical protein
MRSNLLARHEAEDCEETNSRAPAHAPDGETNSKISQYFEELDRFLLTQLQKGQEYLS